MYPYKLEVTWDIYDRCEESLKVMQHVMRDVVYLKCHTMFSGKGQCGWCYVLTNKNESQQVRGGRGAYVSLKKFVKINETGYQIDKVYDIDIG